MSGVTNRAFSLALVVSALLSALYLLISPEAMTIFIIGMIVGVALITWVIWHVGSGRVARLMIYRDIRRKDVALISLAESSISLWGIKSILRFSLHPALLSFSVVSLTYQGLGIPIDSLERIVELMLIALFVLPLSVFVAAKWVIENSNTVRWKRGERFPRSATYVEYVDTLTDFGAALGLILTVAETVRSEHDPMGAFGLSVAIPLFLIILLVSPSLVTTALFFRFSLPKRLQDLRRALKPMDVDVRVELRCRKCGSQLNLTTGLGYCSDCGTKIVRS